MILVVVVGVCSVVALVSLPPARAARARCAATTEARARRCTRPPRARRRERLLDDAYPDALDLLVIAVQSGHLPLEALSQIRAHVHPLIADAIAELERCVRSGRRAGEALPVLADRLGTRALALVATLQLADRTGLAAAPMIDRIGDDVRLHRRRRAESEARELPVRLAMPLVLCILPSFVLIAIAPLLVGALSSLRGI
jgi:tight adherence protein C